tara:strand:- start:283 stop:942 length:660 start_codon:yes stop_codon:yes gene_type:complete
MEIHWEPIQLPNIPLHKTRLSKEVMDYLWSVIRQAETDNVDNSNDYSDRLAGNITGSLGLKDKDDYFLKEVVGPLTDRIVSEDPKNFSPPVDFSLHEKYQAKLHLNWWVNYQYQTEFNPSHAHSGITSFVIWMKIPTKAKEQHNLSFRSDAASDFQFTYSNILGHVTELPIFMDPEMEGNMLVFPSSLHHQVYPFYNTDEARISIAGNLLWNNYEFKED